MKEKGGPVGLYKLIYGIVYVLKESFLSAIKGSHYSTTSLYVKILDGYLIKYG